MARMLGAIWLGEHSPKRPIVRYDRVIVHTMVSRAPAHAAHFSITGDGKIYQSRDTRYQSGVSLEGNPTSIGIESEDRGPFFPDWDPKDGHAVPGFTKAQIQAIARVLAWAHQTHGIPLEPCPDSRPGSRGIAYHRQGIDGNFLAEGYKYGGRVSGGERWSETFGKVCPGDVRITQLLTEVVPLARQIAGLDREDDMTLEELLGHKLRLSPNAGELVTGKPQTVERTVEQVWEWTYARVTHIDNRMSQIEAKLDQLLANQQKGDE